MHRSISLAFVYAVATICLAFVSGCGKTPSDGTDATTTAAVAQSPSTEAVTRAAANFLDAVIKGDTQRAGASLTPQAMQRIIASGKPFAPKGMEKATFRVGEVRTPAADRAFVHCIVTDTSADKTESEDMCCLMRLVENEWRVSGIAYWGPNQSGTMSDFETGQSMPIPRMQSSPNSPAQSASLPSGSTLPPQVASEPGSKSAY